MSHRASRASRGKTWPRITDRTPVLVCPLSVQAVHRSPRSAPRSAQYSLCTDRKARRLHIRCPAIATHPLPTLSCTLDVTNKRPPPHSDPRSLPLSRHHPLVGPCTPQLPSFSSTCDDYARDPFRLSISPEAIACPYSFAIFPSPFVLRCSTQPHPPSWPSYEQPAPVLTLSCISRDRKAPPPPLPGARAPLENLRSEIRASE